jgi:hypothetical protein
MAARIRLDIEFPPADGHGWLPFARQRRPREVAVLEQPFGSVSAASIHHIRHTRYPNNDRRHSFVSFVFCRLDEVDDFHVNPTLKPWALTIVRASASAATAIATLARGNFDYFHRPRYR